VCVAAVRVQGTRLRVRVELECGACFVDDTVLLPQDCVMAGGSTGRSRAVWVFVVIGGVVGVALGIVVAVTTDIPLAPEVGLVVGLAAGWGVSLMRN
jgi:hypothetical protein